MTTRRYNPDQHLLPSEEVGLFFASELGLGPKEGISPMPVPCAITSSVQIKSKPYLLSRQHMRVRHNMNGQNIKHTHNLWPDRVKTPCCLKAHNTPWKTNSSMQGLKHKLSIHAWTKNILFNTNTRNKVDVTILNEGNTVAVGIKTRP